MSNDIVPTSKGRPPIEYDDLTRELVINLIKTGRSQEEISKVLGITPKTFRKHFRDEWDSALVDVEIKITKSLEQQALDGNVSAQKFWLSKRVPKLWGDNDTTTNENDKLSNDDIKELDSLVLELTDVEYTEK